MKVRSMDRRSRGRAVAVLAVGCALAGCEGGDLLPPEERAAVCVEPSGYPAPQAYSSDSLFVPLDEPALTAEQEQRLAIIRGQPTTARVLVARLAADADEMLQSGGSVMLTVSPTRSFMVAATYAGRRDADVFAWHGRIVGDYGDATLILTSKGITGAMQVLPPGLPSTTYSIQPIGDGLQAIVCVDQGRIPPND
jgi:hypothetical protein